MSKSLLKRFVMKIFTKEFCYDHFVIYVQILFIVRQKVTTRRKMKKCGNTTGIYGKSTRTNSLM